MPVYHHILGQLAPVATVPSAVYVCPADLQAIVSSIIVCNYGGITDKFRMWTVKAGDPVSANSIIYWDVDSVPGNNTFVLTGGITLGPGEAVYAYSLNGTSAFNVYGKEEK